jgi:hypothetical protein
MRLRVRGTQPCFRLRAKRALGKPNIRLPVSCQWPQAGVGRDESVDGVASATGSSRLTWRHSVAETGRNKAVIHGALYTTLKC